MSVQGGEHGVVRVLEGKLKGKIGYYDDDDLGEDDEPGDAIVGRATGPIGKGAVHRGSGRFMVPAAQGPPQKSSTSALVRVEQLAAHRSGTG